MNSDIRLFGISAVLVFLIGNYIISVSSAPIILFVGFSCNFLGLIFAGYALIILAKYRKQQDRPIQDAITDSRKRESDLPPQSAHTHTLDNSESNDSTTKKSFVTQFEQLISAQKSGTIDEYTYNSCRQNLLHHPHAPRRTSVNQTTESTLNSDDAMIDYLEGIISSDEYERRASTATRNYES